MVKDASNLASFLWFTHCWNRLCETDWLGLARTLKKQIFSKSPILKKFRGTSNELYLKLVGLIDAKGIDVDQQLPANSLL